MKNQFPLLVKQPELVYLDNAATTQKPSVMLTALSDYYINSNSNIGRGVYELANASESAYVKSKEVVAKFINCNKNNLAYTSGCTESLNLAAHLASQKINKKYILLPINEHHANILIWQNIAKNNNLEIYWVDDPELILNPSNIDRSVLNNTSIMAIAHVSNVTGEVLPVEEWCRVASKIGAVSVIDGAQGVTSLKIDINAIGCDFYAFSSHKLYGPMGLGVLFIGTNFLGLEPLKLGGGIVEDVELHGYDLLGDISRYEAGTPNVANAYAFAKSLEFLNENNWISLLKNTHEVAQYLNDELINIGIHPLEISKEFKKTHISSFVLPRIHAHDVGTFLAKKNIAVRVGKHCAFPLHKHLKVSSSVRASIGIYNTKDDVDALINAIKSCIQYFSKEF